MILSQGGYPVDHRADLAQLGYLLENRCVQFLRVPIDVSLDIQLAAGGGASGRINPIGHG
jgi:hypothetical protein